LRHAARPVQRRGRLRSRRRRGRDRRGPRRQGDVPDAPGQRRQGREGEGVGRGRRLRRRADDGPGVALGGAAGHRLRRAGQGVLLRQLLPPGQPHRRPAGPARGDGSGARGPRLHAAVALRARAPRAARAAPPGSPARLSGAAPRARYRVAFLTPEYPTELTGEGGVGSYVHKTAHLLARDGHDCTVFVTSDADERLRDGDVAVVRVARSRSSALRGLAWLLRRLDRASGYLPAYVANARRLAAALEAEHERAPFHLVQSANLRLAGLFVRRREGRRHLVRISTSRLLYEPAAGRPVTALARLTERLDVVAQRRADACYAPSRLLQRHFADTYGLEVGLVRPPLPVDVGERTARPAGLPERYLAHFGSLGRRKGT